MLEQLKLLFESVFELIIIFLNPVLLIPILIFIWIYYYKVKKYKDESYYKITNVSYFGVRHNTGKYGEYLTYKYLKNFETQGARFLFNIYVPKKDEETSEIDVLMISHKGLFVFESKNYSGWIFGSDNRKYWYQTLPSGRGKSHKEKFYNPIFQNNTHLKYIKSLIGEQIPMYSIITFSDRCTLKNIKLQTLKVHVINRYQVYNLVSSIYNHCPEDLLSDMQIEEIYNTLYPYTQVDEKIRQKHIDNIYHNLNGYNNVIVNMIISNDKDVSTCKMEDNNKEDKIINTVDNIEIENKQIVKLDNNTITDAKNNEKGKNESLICPICNSKLVLRTAKHGVHAGENFYGCSNYPKCKYIR